MKKIYSSIVLLCLFIGFTASAQDKTKKPSDKKISEYDEIIIKQKNPGKNAKVIVEVRDGDVIVNGKPIEKFEDKEIIVQRRSPRVITLNDSRSPFREPGASYDMHFDNDFNLESDVRPFLGVSTEKTEGGVKVQDVTENSSAEKAGIKEGDIITKVNEKKIEKASEKVVMFFYIFCRTCLFFFPRFFFLSCFLLSNLFAPTYFSFFLAWSSRYIRW